MAQVSGAALRERTGSLQKVPIPQSMLYCRSAKTIMRSQSCQRCNKRVQAFVKKDVFVAKNYKYATFVARIYKVWSFFVLRERLPTSATLLLTEPKRSEYL